MKHIKSLLLIVLMLDSCARPAATTPTPTFTQELTSPKSTPDVSATAPVSVTPDTAMGKIEGNISWSIPTSSAQVPVSSVNLKISGHSGSYPSYKTSVDLNGHYSFPNIEPMNYGIGIFFNLPIGERLCENPEFHSDNDLDWLHYATALRGDIWHDILFSNKDVNVNAKEVFVLDFVLKCP